MVIHVGIVGTDSPMLGQIGTTLTLYAVTDPSTGKVLHEYPTATDAAVEQAIAAADRAHREW